MWRNPVFATIFGSIYVCCYCLFVVVEDLRWLAASLFFFSPILILWLAYVILRFGKYPGPDLKEDEFGYQDRPRDSLRIF